MAERRMFAKTIIDSDAFLDMPLSTQALYFHLSMRADDEGFVNNPRKIQRMIGASDDDLRVLCAKRFIITFESGVIVIKHWRMHNYIQKDRFKPTVYQEEKSLLAVNENNAYTECIQNGSKVDTQDRLGKDRIEIGKDIYKERSTAQCADDEKKDFAINEMVYNVITYLNQRTGSKFRHNNPKTITLIKGRMKENYTLEDFKKVIDNKIEDWTGTEFAKHLNPETLFCAKHFETYLNAEIIKSIKPGHFANERTYTKAEMDALYDNIEDIEF